MFVNETALKKLMNGETLTLDERKKIERSLEALRFKRETEQKAKNQLEEDVLDCLKKHLWFGVSLADIRSYLLDLDSDKYQFITEAKIRSVITKLNLDNCADNYRICTKEKKFSTELGTVKRCRYYLYVYMK